MKKNFIKLDKKNITNYSGKEILILWYIHNHYIVLNNTCSFKLKDLILECGYTPHYNKTNQEFINTINSLIQKQIIVNLIPINSKDTIIVSYVLNNNKNFYDNLSHFICCNSVEIQSFVEAKENKILSCKMDTIIQIYYYLKSFTYELNEFKYCYPSVSLICEQLHISNKTVIQALKDLEKMHFIYKYQFGTYEDTKGKINFCPNIYAFEKYMDTLLQQDFSTKLKKFKKWL